MMLNTTTNVSLVKFTQKLTLLQPPNYSYIKYIYFESSLTQSFEVLSS